MPAVNMRHDAYDVRIDRKTKFGNPFVMRHEAERDEVCEKYRRWLFEQINAGAFTLEEIADLRGKRLGCWCAPKRCHGDTLAAAAEWAHAELGARNDAPAPG